jgi:5,10-methylenetetrahydromethanopterin reductase
MREIYVGEYGDSAQVAAIAKRREADGYDGLLVGDSQNRYCDPFVTLTLVAEATEHIRIGTAVTNPVTRHPASMACAFSSLQQVSSGRVVAGIGRGDSSLAFLGAAPVSPVDFGRYLCELRSYLRGEEVAIDHPTYLFDGTELRNVVELKLGDRPPLGRLQWLSPDLPAVPVDVFATGPKMIALGATAADRMTLSVGADPARISWAIELAHAARRDAGMDENDMDLGASFAIGLHDDFATARDMIAGVVSVMARFAIMHGTPVGPMSGATADVLQRVHDVYDMKNHARVGSHQDVVLDDDFISTYAVVGPAGHCRERLLELFEIGLRRVHLLFHAQAADADQTEMAYRRFAAEVMPALKSN